ncbi:pentapeptide repeat-containing protein [Flammeovirga sp. SJP92]|uniref:pentapeptide repeat-containing protein n=1 Tax=Flammeovirga sp. SJP92 TaxID=1775430 RepID=UPI000788B817|nr:pentapeptide repeat-containing protein [Flammeovirga sp. SJP92]KXX70936.1 hypothetical protein AVL50_11240 [Flammeovirga sp. SJP92]
MKQLLLSIILVLSLTDLFAQEVKYNVPSGIFYLNRNYEKKEVEYDSVKEKKDIIFRILGIKDKYLSDEVFYDVQFHSNVDFDYTQFHLNVNFDGVQFHSKTAFREAQFHSNAGFRVAQFDFLADFDNAQFHSNVYFNGAQFDSLANFNYAQFHSFVDFNYAKFNSGAYFRKTQFDSLANFYGAQFKGKVNFDYTLLPDTIIFDHTTTEKIIDLTLSRLDSNKRECVISLFSTNIEKFKFDYNLFKIYHDTTRNYTATVSIYEQVMAMQKKYGYTSGYEKADKEKKEFVYLEKAKKGKWAYIKNNTLNFLDKYWWDYGYNKTLVFRNTLVIFFLFHVINIFAIYFHRYSYETHKKAVIHYKSIIEIYNIESIQYLLDSEYWFIRKIYHPFLYTAFIFFGLKLDFKAINYRNVPFTLLIYIEYSVGLICLAYLANTIIVG